MLLLLNIQIESRDAQKSDFYPLFIFLRTMFEMYNVCWQIKFLK